MLLNAHTQYSYKYGILTVEQLLKTCVAKGHQAIALTDINSTSAVIDFIRQAKDYPIHAIAGIDFRNGAQQQYVGIAQNKEGYRELNEHLSYHAHHNIPFGQRAPAFHHAFIIYPKKNKITTALRENEYIGISIKDLTQLPLAPKEEQHKWVLLQPATFTSKRDHNAHRLLRAIDNNMLLSRLPKSEEGLITDTFYSPDELKKFFESYPFIITNTERLMAQCHLSFDFHQSKNKKVFTSSVAEDLALIKQECTHGLAYRYGKNIPQEVHQRLAHELAIIAQMGFLAYFLINWDMVNYARHKGYYYVGRGSGANSLVAYLLRITDVDPISLNLYFERFINPHRSTPPDFDIDFSWTDRPDVTQYLFEKYKWKHTALLGAYITFQEKSVIRELGKVFGLPAHEIDALQNGRKTNRSGPLEAAILNYTKLIEGMPSHLSIHASGIVISEEPISAYTATMLPPKGFPTTHFSMIEAEDIKLQKFDVLGQRGLGKIKDAIKLIRTHHAVEIDVHDTQKFTSDLKVQALLKQGHAIGCFYIESPAMRMLLTKLKANDYLRLVAASSIIRPGVAQSGMMREYILRFQDEQRREAAKQANPELYALLEETYGVMVYQEDVLKVAHHYAGLTLAQADVLRRGMNFKFKQRQEFASIKDLFFDNCRKKGKNLKDVQDIWFQMESFASFAFAKGHSASFAVESFQALYLKAHYPIEYMTATINNGGGFYSTELYLHEARKHGATVALPHINQSQDLHTLQDDTIFLGFNSLSGIEAHTVACILQERQQRGYFKSLENFLARVPITLDQAILLIRIGAFSFTQRPVKELLWEAHLHLNKGTKTKPAGLLFESEAKKYQLPRLWDHPLEEAYTQMELLGFTLADPFSLLKHAPEEKRLAGHLPFCIGKQVHIVAYLIHRKRTATSRGEEMYFGTWLDRRGEWVDTVHFPPVAKAFPFTGPGCYALQGKVMEEFGFITIEVSSMQRLPFKTLDEVATENNYPQADTPILS